MPRLGERVLKVRSKNAGPFWVTVDVFCGTPDVFEQVRNELRTEAVAALFQQPSQLMKRFDIADLNVIKFSFPRPVVQVTIGRAVQGLIIGLETHAQQASPLASAGHTVASEQRRRRAVRGPDSGLRSARR